MRQILKLSICPPYAANDCRLTLILLRERRIERYGVGGVNLMVYEPCKNFSLAGPLSNSYRMRKRVERHARDKKRGITQGCFQFSAFQ
jgi:hypothetical protein